MPGRSHMYPTGHSVWAELWLPGQWKGGRHWIGAADPAGHLCPQPHGVGVHDPLPQ